MNALAFDDYERFDAVGLAALVPSGQVHPAELVEAAVVRIASRNPALNAVIVPMYERAREAAQRHSGAGPLAGVPLLVRTSSQARRRADGVGQPAAPFDSLAARQRTRSSIAFPLPAAACSG